MRHRFASLILCLAFLSATACDDGGTTGTLGDTAASDTTGTDATDVSADTTPSPPLAFCEGATTFDYDPLGSEVLTAFPDDAWTAAADSPTGLRVVTGGMAWLDAMPDFLRGPAEDLAALDGWGTSAGILLHFSAPVGDVPSGEAASLASDAVMLLALDGGGAERVPFESQRLDDGATIVLWPMRPLRPRSRYAAVVTTALTAADGGCVSPSPTLRALLSGAPDDPGLAPLAPRYAELLAGTGLRADDVSAALVYTTGSVGDASRAAAADIAARTYAWKTAPACKDKAAWRFCKGTFTAWDYRHEGYLGDAITPVPYEIPVWIWLPPKRAGARPFPTIIFGHGIGGEAADGEFVARKAAPLGVATVAISTLRHGDHPTARAGVANADVLDLFGLDLGSFTLDGLVFRENLRQAALDKLQLTALLRAAPDVTGDGRADLDAERFAYYGISLGGIMGPDLLALGTHIGAAVLAVAGGRLVQVITEGDSFSVVKNVLIQLLGDPDGVERIAPIVQTLIDAGDPVNYAPHVLGDRFGGAPPHVLQQMVIGDETVPNVTNRSLARALGVTLVPPVLQEVGLIDVAATAPLRGNRDEGALTAGLFQFDRTSRTPGGAPSVATHGSVFSGIEPLEQAYGFLNSYFAGEVPVITDPYADLHTPPLP